jgi:hypothetical protein
MRRTLALLVVALLSGACEPPEGPALEVFLQVVRARPDVDTSDVTGFLVQINDDETAIPFDPTATVPIALEAAPGPATIIVYACTISAQCEERFGVFAGCVVEDLAPSAEPLPLTVELDVRDSENVPASCAGLVSPIGG